MKIAVFENQYDSVKGAFETANLLNYNNTLEIEVFPSSQTADLTELTKYLAIFVDIDLSAKSELDGFALIQKIRTINDSLTSKIIILTGNNKIKEILKSREIYSKLIQIIIKPTNYEEITESINKVI
jgi:DNA-binding LytR/AlgR family response regulator